MWRVFQFCQVIPGVLQLSLSITKCKFHFEKIRLMQQRKVFPAKPQSNPISGIVYSSWVYSFFDSFLGDRGGTVL